MVSLTTDHYICTSGTSTFLAFHDSKHYYATFVKSRPCHNTSLFLPIGYKHLFLLHSLPHSIVITLLNYGVNFITETGTYLWVYIGTDFLLLYLLSVVFVYHRSITTNIMYNEG